MCDIGVLRRPVPDTKRVLGAGAPICKGWTMARNHAVRYALAGVATSVVMMPGVASADTKSTQGDDFSVDQNNRRRMITCDQEADQEQVHADIKDYGGTTVGVYVRDSNGAGNDCSSRSRQKSELSVGHHRTVEERPLGDIFGNWVSTT